MEMIERNAKEWNAILEALGKSVKGVLVRACVCTCAHSGKHALLMQGRIHLEVGGTCKVRRPE